MLGHLRPMLARCVVISLACATALPALAASRGGGFARPRIITAPRFVPRLGAHPRVDARGLGAHRFRDRRGIGLDGGVGAYPVPVPVPVGGDQPSAEAPSEASPTEDYGSGYRAPSRFAPGPQIITLPDPPRRRASRAARRDEAPLYTPPPPRHYAHHYRHRPSYGEYGGGYGYRAGYRRAYLPSYAYEPSPVALFPCNDSPYAPIYNTPCGLRPFQ